MGRARKFGLTVITMVSVATVLLFVTGWGSAVASNVMSVIVTNTSSNPVPVQAVGTVPVNVAPQAPVTDGGTSLHLQGGDSAGVGTSIASTLSIHMTSGISFVRFLSSNPLGIPAEFAGPASDGNGSIILTLTRPIQFDRLICFGPSSDACAVSWVGAQPQ